MLSRSYKTKRQEFLPTRRWGETTPNLTTTEPDPCGTNFCWTLLGSNQGLRLLAFCIAKYDSQIKLCCDCLHQKNPRAPKNRIGTSTPPSEKNPDPPPPNEEFYGHGGFSSRKNEKSQAPSKNWRSHFRAQNCGQKNYGHEAFSEFKYCRVRNYYLIVSKRALSFNFSR